MKEIEELKLEIVENDGKRTKMKRNESFLHTYGEWGENERTTMIIPQVSLKIYLIK